MILLILNKHKLLIICKKILIIKKFKYVHYQLINNNYLQMIN